MFHRFLRSSATAILFFVWPSVADASQFFTVRDAIEMTTFVDPYPSRQIWPPSNRFKFSPDGHYVAIVTQRGVLDSSEAESTLWVYDVAAIQRFVAKRSGTPPVPKKLARMTAEFNANTEDDPTITNLRWLRNGKLAFLGQNKSSKRSLYVVAVDTGVVKCLTSAKQDVSQYDVVDDTVLYVVTVPKVAQGEKAVVAPAAMIGTGHSLMSLEFPDDENGTAEKTIELWIIRAGKASPVFDVGSKRHLRVPESPFANYGSNVLALAPSRHSAVITLPPRRIPKLWESYEPYPSSFGDTIRLKATRPGVQNDDNARVAVQYALVNLDTGRVSTLLNAPLGLAMLYYAPAHASWSRDGNKLLLVNTFLPLEGVGESERRLRMKRPCVVVYNVTSHNANCIAPVTQSDEDTRGNQRGVDFYSLIDASWGPDDRTVVLSYYSSANGDDEHFSRSPEIYRFGDSGWVKVSDASQDQLVRKTMIALKPPIALSIHEDLNTPEMLYAEDPISLSSARLWNPNPQLESVDLGEASVYRWRDESGRAWVGGLVLPPDYKPGRKYPLVIQTHGFARRRFLAMGAYTSASAARPLAAKGMIVLQVPDSHDGYLTAREPLVHLAGFEAAIDKLAFDGLVDPSRVGIIGFSRTCYYALVALERAPKRFAAATIADGRMYGYMQYLTATDNPGDTMREQVANIIGAQPFGEGLKAWLAESPGFNLDKVTAPVRAEAYGRSSLVFNWDIYAGLRMQGKPVDLIFFPEARHVLSKPQERLASEQGNVDWFDFWLQGHEDPDPAKRQQYLRWEALCTMQRSQNPTRAAFCVPGQTH
jgi:dipeptidyl aminopeptidase/acylaminoacyl peptidase